MLSGMRICKYRADIGTGIILTTFLLRWKIPNQEKMFNMHKESEPEQGGIQVTDGGYFAAPKIMKKEDLITYTTSKSATEPETEKPE